MASNIRIECSTPEDVPRLMEIVVPAFCEMQYERLVGHVDTPGGRQVTGAHHLRAWHDHASVSSQPFSIKCIHTDDQTREENIVATAEWAIYEKKRGKDEYTKPNYLLSADWVEEAATKREALEIVHPLQDYRVKWLGGRPHALLLYMATDPKFQRRGAATKCVQWGLDKCRELGIPAYLEASEDGKKVYEKMGFEVFDRIPNDSEGEPVMIWWPNGTRAEDKRPVSPD